MGYGVGASGFVGFGLETTSGTYVPPTHFLSLRNESLHYVQETHWRRVMRGTADVSGALAGNVRVEGSVDVELIEDSLINLLRCARGAIVKTGAATPWTYTFTPNSAVEPPRTASFTVVRNGQVFAYTGCVVSAMSFTTDGGILVGSFDILGRDEASQTLPVATFSNLVPYATGQYSIEIPTATQVFDVENFTFAVNDNAEAQYRLKNTNRGATFVKLGERSVEISVNRDFQDRTEYEAFKALTSQSIRIKASKSADQSVQFTAPAAVKDAYDISGLSGQADLIMAAVRYVGTNAGAGAYTIVAVSDVDVTIP